MTSASVVLLESSLRQCDQIWRKFATLAKFKKSLRNFKDCLFNIGKLLCQLRHFYAIGPIVIVVNGQRFNNKIAIRSHCLTFTRQICLSSVYFITQFPKNKI